MGEGGTSAPRPLPAAEGLKWVGAGVALLRRQPLRILLLGLVLQLIAGLAQVGVLGVVFVICVPALTSGMLQGLHRVRGGHRPSMLTLFAAFATPARLLQLLLFGGLMLASAILAVGLALSGSVQDLDPALLARLEAGDVAAVSEIDPAFIQRLLIAMGMGLLVSGCLSYFTVPLVWFAGCPLGRAIVAGVVALVRQWRALLVMGGVLALVALPVAVMTAILLVAQGAGQASSAVLTLLLLLIVVGYQVLLFSTQYAAFCGVFGTPGGEPRDEPRGDQLVA